MSLQIAAFLGRSGPLRNAWLLENTRAHIQNNTLIVSSVLTARRYASAVCAMALCLCLCVTSRSSTKMARHRITQNNITQQPRDSRFLTPKISAKFDRGQPLRGRQMQVWWVRIGDFRQITGYISKTVQEYKIDAWFLLKSNRKLYGLYRMVTLPMTLSDL